MKIIFLAYRPWALNVVKRFKKHFKKKNILIIEKNSQVKKLLRFKNEPVRHKTLDLIGDLALLGTPIKGHVTAARAGHASNVEFVKKLKRVYSTELEELWNGDSHE